MGRMKRKNENAAPHPAGILVLNKPGGVTSRQVVDRVARLLPGTKVGHAGTLDPLATGILVVCVGHATRLVANVQDMSKSYEAMIRLDGRSDTLDADGEIVAVACTRIPDRAEIEEAIRPLTGEVVQRPPAYSALKIKGKRAYDLARAGEPVEPEARTVRIDRINVNSYAWPRLKIEVDCGGGTYIRSIARDLGDALQCGGYIETLVRTRTGPFTLDQAIDPEILSTESILSLLRPTRDAVPDLPTFELDTDQLEQIGQGKRLPIHDLRPEFSGHRGELALINAAGVLVAIAELDPERAWIQPRKVLG